MSDELRAALQKIFQPFPAELQDWHREKHGEACPYVWNSQMELAYCRDLARHALAQPPAPDAGARVVAAAKRVRAAWDNDKNLGRDKYMLRLADEFIELEDALDALDGDADARGGFTEPPRCPECGIRYQHDQDCETGRRERIAAEPAPPRTEGGGVCRCWHTEAEHFGADVDSRRSCNVQDNCGWCPCLGFTTVPLPD